MAPEPDTSVFDDGTWWETQGFLTGLDELLGPARIPYMRSVLPAVVPKGARILDVGTGSGGVAAELRGWGYLTYGLDPSSLALRSAAKATGVCLIGGIGESMPFPDSTFDAVVCSEVLEHVASPRLVVSEMARVSKTGAVLFFSTPNRTVTSRVTLIEAAQRWTPTRLLPDDLHLWERLIRPAELSAMLAGAGFDVKHITGVGPRLRSIPSALLAAIRLRRGRIGYSEAGRRMALHAIRSRAIAYMGWARKAG